MPFGKNSCLTALRHFPRWHQLACASLNGICAGICSILLFISSPKLTAQYIIPFFTAFWFKIYSFSPIHPEEANGPDTKAAQDLSPYWRVPVPPNSVKYGAGWDKRRTSAKDFHDYLLVLSPWITSSRFLSIQVFALMQKMDCLSRNAASLTFSVSLLAKFCIA